MTDTVARAHDTLAHADEKVREAEAARATARTMLDAALEALGWTRLADTDTYIRRGFGGFAVPLERVLDEIKREAPTL